MKIRKKLLFVCAMFLLVACAVIPGTRNEQILVPTELNTKISSKQTVQATKTVTPSVTQSVITKSSATLQEVGFYQTPTYRGWPTETRTLSSKYSPTPTPYPTFHLEDVITVIPAQPALCPIENLKFLYTEKMLDTLENGEIFDFVNMALNAGASFDQIDKKLYEPNERVDPVYQLDITGDQVKELIIKDFGHSHLVAITCEQGKYRSVLNFSTASMGGLSIPEIIHTEDLNLNGIPDVVIAYSLSNGGNTSLDIFEWDGFQLNSLRVLSHGHNAILSSRFAQGLYWYLGEVVDWWDYSVTDTPFAMNCHANINIIDIDNNGTKEVILNDDGPCHIDTLLHTGPYLGQEITFTWNGNSFLFSDYRIDPAKYRYQAVQEADRAFILREYDRALALYDEVINNKTLEWWSLDQMKYLYDVYQAQLQGRDTTEIREPRFRIDEYQHLSAYARYRIMMIQLAAGKKSEAYYSYQLLDQIYTETNPGYAHAEIGRIYWSAVEDGMTLIEACQPAIKYVTEHPKLLEALGDQWHGGQSHIYTVEDICPLDEMDVEMLQE